MKSLKLTHYDLHHDSSLKKYQKCISWKYNSKRKLDAVDLVPSPTKYYKLFISSYITYANEKKKLLALASIPYTWMISNVVRYHPVKESIHSQSCGKYYLGYKNVFIQAGPSMMWFFFSCHLGSMRALLS